MKVTKVLRIVLRGMVFCAVGLSCVSCEVHPLGPRYEIYEVIDPHTHRAVVRIKNTQWPDGRRDEYYGIIKFRQLDGSVLSVELLSNDPNLWTVQFCKPGEEPNTIALNRIYGPSPSPRNFYHKCWVEEGESFGE